MHLPEWRSRDVEKLQTAGWTAIVAVTMLALLAFIPLGTRNARGQQREMTGVEIWRRTLTHLPADAPFFLNTWTLTALSALALILSAYIIVAIARTPR